MSENEPSETHSDGVSKVKLISNTKGVNIEVTAGGKDYQNLEAIKQKAVEIFESLRNAYVTADKLDK